MLYLRGLVVLLMVGLLANAGLQDKDKDKDKDTIAKKDKDEKPKDKDDKKLKGFLPANFGKLGLSDTQKQKIYALQAAYKDKLAELEKTKAKLKADEKEAIEKVLTPEQLKELQKLRLGEKEK